MDLPAELHTEIASFVLFKPNLHWSQTPVQDFGTSALTIHKVRSVSPYWASIVEHLLRKEDDAWQKLMKSERTFDNALGPERRAFMQRRLELERWKNCRYDIAEGFIA